MPTTVDFNAITVELRDATNNTIPAKSEADSGSRVIEVRPGEDFSICVDFGEVSGAKPGNYSVQISLAVGAKKREKGWQRQDWCMGDSFQASILTARRCSLCQSLMKRHADQVAYQEEGTIKVTISRVNIGYGAGTAEDELRPEVPHGAMKQKDRSIGNDVFIVDPETFTNKGHAAKASSHKVFTYKNIGAAYDSDEDEPSKKHHRDVLSQAPVVQGTQGRAAAKKAQKNLSNMQKDQEQLGLILDWGTESLVPPTQAHGEGVVSPQTTRKARQSRTARKQPSRPQNGLRDSRTDKEPSHDSADENDHGPEHVATPEARRYHNAHAAPRSPGSQKAHVKKHSALRPRATNTIRSTRKGDGSVEDNGSEAQSCVGNALAPAAIMQEPDFADSKVGQGSKRSSPIPRTRRQASQGNPKGGKRKRSGEAVVPNTVAQDSATAVDSPNFPGDEEPKISSPRPHADSGTPFSEKAEEFDGVFEFSKIPQQSQPNPRSGGAGDAIVKREPLGGTPAKARTEQADESTPVRQQENLVGSGEEEDAAGETAAQRAPEAPSNPAGTGPVVASEDPKTPSEETEPTLKPTIKSLKLRIEYIEAQMRLRAIRIRKNGENVEDDERYAELDEEKHACEYKKGEMEEAQAARDQRGKELEMSK
ncbi:hypothetical protein TI39_contig285g00034 [Zymoseptoria brevis]|uniref:Uncharacterized protein n=1 Tax=Zymoseptoria brevis TaxID=1047168 RepID=A0A0F4GX44_9PEZI|nr:hypothetical protein TI39_contig285g00034 [Zymoseptoria brevis]